MKITAVGGYNAVGRNMTGIHVGDETVAIDNGIRLDTLQMYDAETSRLRRYDHKRLIEIEVIPEYTLLKDVKAQIISHGHLDHLGALSITKPTVPIIATPYTVEIGRKDYKEGDFYSMDYDEFFQISPDLSVELIEVTHSIPQASIVVLHTPEGDVVYANDFKFDDHSRIAKNDYRKLRKIGKGNVRVLIAESTNVRRIGKTHSERVAKIKLNDVLESIDQGLIAITTFSSHIERIRNIIDEVEKMGRIPMLLGRSFLYHVELAEKFGFLDLPPTTRVFGSSKAITNALGEIRKDRDKYALIVTGHQGEKNSVLNRLVEHKLSFKFQKNDSVIFCARIIPTPISEVNRYILETKLKASGVRIFKDIHVSGHASREDHRRLINLIKPQHIVPAHGGTDMRAGYADLAVEEGYELNKEVHLLNNGLSIEL